MEGNLPNSMYNRKSGTVIKKKTVQRIFIEIVQYLQLIQSGKNQTVCMYAFFFLFQVFYFSHLLYVIYWVLLIFHAPNFWKWFVGPCAIFLIEKIFRMARSLSEEGKTWVTMGVVLPSKVVSLVIRRPPHFTFKPGDYIFINIPVIATFEWHPFTIR